MTTRSHESVITFEHSFMLSCFDERRPAGAYRVVTDEEEISGLSFVAYRRVATRLYTPAVSVLHGVYEVFTVDASELECALEADARG